MLTTPEYESKTSFSGPAAVALETARITFLGHGFEVVRATDQTLEVRGPGMSSNKQPPLHGVSEATVEVRGSHATIRARLGGVATMKRFTALFPAGLGLFFFLMFGVTDGFGESWKIAAGMAPFALFFPLLGVAIEKKTRGAVDGLLRSMKEAARTA